MDIGKYTLKYYELFSQGFYDAGNPDQVRKSYRV